MYCYVLDIQWDVSMREMFNNLDVSVRRDIHCLEWMGTMERLHHGYWMVVDRWVLRGVGHSSSDPRFHRTIRYLVYG